MSSLNKINQIPRKSSSLLIFSTNTNKNSQFDYKLLMLRRNSNMSFGNAYAFPGGVLETQDSYLLKQQRNISEQNFYLTETLKLTAIRETIEECGIACGFSKESNQIIKKEKLTNFDQIYSQTQDAFSSLKCFMRLITPQFLGKRYDTQFYTVDCRKNPFINLQNFEENNESIKINLSESQNFDWVSPEEALSNYYRNEWILSPPQLIILGILYRFPHLDDFQMFIQQIFQQSLQIQSASEANKFKQNPLTFPVILVKNNLKWHMPGDKNYNLEEMLKNEQCPDFKQMLYYFHENLDKNKNFNVEMEIKNQLFFIKKLNVDLEYQTPFSNFKQFQDIQPKI